MKTSRKQSILANSKVAERWWAALLDGKRLHAGHPGHQLDVHFEGGGLESKQRPIPKWMKEAMKQAQDAEPKDDSRPLRVVGLTDKPGHGGVGADHYVLVQAEDFRDLLEIKFEAQGGMSWKPKA